MSLHLEFEPHSWYMGFAIQKTAVPMEYDPTKTAGNIWNGYTDNGNTYQIDSLTSLTLVDLKKQIRDYHTARRERDLYNRRMLGEVQ